MDFNIPEDMKMVQTLAKDFVKDQLIPLEKDVLGRESDLEGARRYLPAETEANLIKMVKDLGLWGLNIPEQFGGVSLGVLCSCLVEEELAKTVLPFDFGDVTPVLFDCTEDQKAEYLVPLMERQKSALLALVETGKGKDPAEIEMKAVKDGDSYILNGKKIAFASSAKADFAIVFAVTDAGKGVREGVTCFLVDAGTAGFSISGGGEKSGLRAQVNEPVTLIFDNCKVPAGKVLGEEGKAFHLGKQWLTNRRIIRAARCVGAAVRILDVAAEHAKSWTSFGQNIAGWPAIQKALADMAVDIHAARLMVHQAASKADEGQDIRDEADMVKVFSTEMLRRVAGNAVLIKNGPGAYKGLPLELLCESMTVRNISDRALDVQKFLIAGDLLKLGKIL